MRPGRSRLAGATALLAVALAVASCGDDDEAPLAPETPQDTTTTTSMLAVDGEAHVSVTMEGSLVENASGGPLGGMFRAVLEDSTGFRVFVPSVHLNGAEFEEELDTFGNPSRITMDIATALPDLAMEDSLIFAIEDGGFHTPPFSMHMAPSRVELLPDSSVVSRSQPIRFRWHGRIERLVLTITDQFSARVRLNLSFENYAGLREITLQPRDLAPLDTGQVVVSTSITDNESRFAGPRLISLVFQSTQRRTWTLVP